MSSSPVTHSYGLTITHVLPVHESGPELEDDVTVVHAVRVKPL